MRPILLALALLLSVPTLAQPASPKFIGSWSGTIKQGMADLEIVLHIAPSDTGGYRVFMDVPSQNVRGMIPPGATVTGGTITIPMGGGARYEGRVDAEGNQILGKMIGASGEEPMNFDRTSATPTLPAVEAAVEDPEGIAGDFAGRIEAGGGLEATIRLRRTANGYAATLDVPAQSAAGLSADSVSIDGNDVAIVWGFGSYRGTLSEDRDAIDGTWTQNGRDMAFDLVRTGVDE